MKACFIFGAMPVDNIAVRPTDDDLVIAADGGFITLEKFSITPDLIVGDFDSLSYTPVGDNVIKHPVKKDETDTILAIDVAFSKGYTNFIIYGCLGGRLDHTLGSIQTAAYVAEKGGTSIFIDNETFLTVIKENTISFSDKNQGVISVFAISEKAEGVDLSGLLYSLKNAELTPDYPLGVSNEFIGENACITVNHGKLCIIWNGKNGEFKIGGQHGK